MKFVPTIRPAIERDAPYLIDIDIKCYDHAWLNEDWALVWGDKDSSILVAVVYGQPVGFIVTEREEYEGRLLNHIYKVAVKEKFRGNNVGKKLLAAAYEEARKSGMQYLSMSVPASMTLEGNSRYCVPWIQKMGFAAVETLPDNTMLWGQTEDVIVFEFKIQ
jgi:ribosomal protein S18 acetylase RimI-like enzyme